MSGPAPKFSVIIPCYNEQDAIFSTLEALESALEGAGEHEILVINDGSTDATAQRLAEATEKHPNVRVVTHERNRGYGAALKTGIRKASASILAITDADGTYPNERLPEFIELIEDADMVVGERALKQLGFARRFAKAFLRRYSAFIAGRAIIDMNSGLRVFRRDVVERFLGVLPDGFSFTTTLTLAMLTNHRDVRYVPIEYKRRIGKSKIQPVRDTLRFLQLIIRTGMYFAPLRVLGPPAALLLMAFVGSFVYDVVVLENLADKTLILLMFGSQLLAIALLADMIDKRSGR